MQAATLRRPALADHQRMLRLADEQVLFNDFEREERVSEYRRRLVRAPWFYEHSDNQSEWRAGRDEFTWLIATQMELDPDAAIWREVAPAQMACGLAIPQPRIVRRTEA